MSPQSTHELVPSKRTLFSKPSAREAELAGDAVFRKWVNEKHGLQLADYWELHGWSVQYVSGGNAGRSSPG